MYLRKKHSKESLRRKAEDTYGNQSLDTEKNIMTQDDLIRASTQPLNKFMDSEIYSNALLK